MSSTEPKRRVAILGGGQAALTAALQLSDPRNPESHDLELTIYQLGWRLGGKGATGRPADGPPRIFEHGLHNWFGFYDNSFRQARDVYRDLDRPPTAPLATFEEAFVPADSGAQVEWIEGEPLLWEITNPRNDRKPGEGGLWLTPLEYIAEALELLERAFDHSPLAHLGHEDDPVLARAHELLRAVAHRHGLGEEVAAFKARHLLHLASVLARAAAGGPEHALAEHVEQLMTDLERDLPHDVVLPHWVREIEDAVLRPMCWLLWLFMFVLWRAVRRDLLTKARTGERRFWIVANLGYACITGAIRDDIVGDGFDVINDRDLRVWLGENAYDDGGALLNSPIVEAIYCGSFAYPKGDTRGGLSHPDAENMEAGTALRGIVRTLLTYKGAFAYRFAAGTADTCYAPAYEVLRKRGVAFRFFSRVLALDLDDEQRIARIHVAEQAQTLDGRAYEPLIDVAGLPCWPLQPRWAQLVGGPVLRDEGADFEWPTPATIARETTFELELGRDFDDVVLGISTAALAPICEQLVSAYPAWRSALAEVQTVRTQSLQLWLSETSQQLGFPFADKPITNWRWDQLSPLDVWGDFSELLAWEHWPAELVPRSLGYFCSTMSDDPEFSDQEQANAQARENALQMLTGGLRILLPGILDADGGVRWGLLVDPSTRASAGPARLDAQWIRANVTPTERYVLSVVGSSRHRLPAHDPAGPRNLYLAGDWTQCTLNCGCMEAATISGMLCSHALSGYPPRHAIVGVDF